MSLTEPSALRKIGTLGWRSLEVESNVRQLNRPKSLADVA